MMDTIINDRRLRKAVYHVLAAALGVAGVYGLLEAEQTEEILKAITALLGVGGVELAAGNTPSEKEKDKGPDEEALAADAEGL